MQDADLERRFGGLKRLYGEAGYQRLRGARIAVIGIGGVGSWAAEALARSGVAALTLVDLDHVAESNVNRQIHALDATLGQAKVLAMQERIAQIHPGCTVSCVDEFVEAGNWPALLPGPVDVVLDACDDPRAKHAIAAWAMRERQPLVLVGAAGGKRQAHLVDVADLISVTHDPLLAQLRQRLRRDQLIPRADRKPRPSGLRCVFSREAVSRPVVEADAACAVDNDASAAGFDANLNCHGYGSVVTVTASFGLVAANEAIQLMLGS
jgi:tRNA A37 threonylcarbamoyladenosine dehydratase